MNPVRAADAAVKAGRWTKAQQFADAAELHRPGGGADDDGQGDVFVTLAVHAGIAAADVICIGALGHYSASGAHDEALALVRKVDRAACTALSRILSVKTKAGYTHRSASASDVITAENALAKLMDVARTWAL